MHTFSESASTYLFEFGQSGTCQSLYESPLWQLPLSKFVQSGLFAFPSGLLPKFVGVPWALPSSQPFPSTFEFRCSTRSSLPLAFPVRVMFESACISKWTLANGCSLLSRGCFLGILFACSFRFYFALAGLSSSRFLALKWEPFDLLLEMSLSHHHQFAKITLLVAEWRLLSVDLQQIFIFVRHYKCASCTDTLRCSR